MDLKFLSLSNLKAGAEDGLEEGQFLAYASTFTRTPDSYGDVVAKGAFLDTIQAWKDSGNTLPILYGHDMADPFSNIGGAIELAEDDRGLLVKGQLDVAENPKAKQVYRMLKGRRINQMSFAYDVQEDGIVEVPKSANSEDTQSARELRKLKVYEVSIVPIGANQDTEVLAVKAMAELAAKAGRTISAKNLESLVSARDAIDAVIKAATPTEDVASPGKSQEDEAQERKSTAARRRDALADVAFITSL